MGLSLPKFAPGNEEKKLKELEEIIEDSYESKFKDAKSFPEFYRAVCEIVEKLNKKFGNTQFELPMSEDLKEEFENRHKKHRKLSKEEFQDIMKNLVKKTRFTGIGGKDVLFYIFGVPLSALLVKQKVMPQSIPNDIFIPGVTSLTVFTLAALNKI